MNKTQIKLYLINLPSNEEVEGSLETGIHPHLGIRAIESFIRREIHQGKLKDDIEIKVLDGEIHDEHYIRNQIVLKKEGKSLFGFYTAVNNYRRTVEFSRHLKDVRKDIAILYGGPWATYLTQQILSTNPYVDAIVRGDGEEAVLRVLRGDLWRDIGGLCYLTQEGEYIHKPLEHMDVKKLPFPFSFTDTLEEYFCNYQKRYSNSDCRMTDAYFSKEPCDRRCSFCSIATCGKKNNRRRPEEAWQECIDLKQRFGVNYVFDVQNNVRLDWLREFARLAPKYNPDLEIRFKFYVSADHVTREFVENFKRAGGDRLFIGFESHDQKILYHSKGKKVAPEDNLRALQLVMENDVSLDAAFILGLPGENLESLQKTEKFIKTCADYKNLKILLCSILVPLPGSLIWHKYFHKIPELRRNYLADESTDVFVPPTWTLPAIQRDFFSVCPDIDVGYESLLFLKNRLKAEIGDKFNSISGSYNGS